jgi:hypothetical protein
MRADFFHLLLERSRTGGRNNRKGRHVAWKDAPSKQSMKKAHTDHKQLNENLAPLKRYLGQQVGRPWNKVNSEIRVHLSPDSAVQLHIIGHLKDFIEVHTVEDKGVYYRVSYYGYLPIRSGMLFVDKHGLIRKAKTVKRKKNSPKPFPEMLTEEINKHVNKEKSVFALHEGVCYKVFKNPDTELYSNWNKAKRIHANQDYGFAHWNLDSYGSSRLIWFFKTYDKQIRSYKSEYLNHLSNLLTTVIPYTGFKPDKVKHEKM